MEEKVLVVYDQAPGVGRTINTGNNLALAFDIRKTLRYHGIRSMILKQIKFEGRITNLIVAE